MAASGATTTTERSGVKAKTRCIRRAVLVVLAVASFVFSDCGSAASSGPVFEEQASSAN